MGYFAGANILMEYVLSNAGAARTFTQYLSVIFGQNHPNAWRIEVEGFVKGHHMHLDLPAVAIILLLTLVLSHRFFFCLNIFILQFITILPFLFTI